MHTVNSKSGSGHATTWVQEGFENLAAQESQAQIRRCRQDGGAETLSGQREDPRGLLALLSRGTCRQAVQEGLSDLATQILS